MLTEIFQNDLQSHRRLPSSSFTTLCRLVHDLTTCRRWGTGVRCVKHSPNAAQTQTGSMAAAALEARTSWNSPNALDAVLTLERSRFPASAFS